MRPPGCAPDAQLEQYAILRRPARTRSSSSAVCQVGLTATLPVNDRSADERRPVLSCSLNGQPRPIIVLEGEQGTSRPSGTIRVAGPNQSDQRVDCRARPPIRKHLGGQHRGCGIGVIQCPDEPLVVRLVGLQLGAAGEAPVGLPVIRGIAGGTEAGWFRQGTAADLLRLRGRRCCTATTRERSPDARTPHCGAPSVGSTLLPADHRWPPMIARTPDHPLHQPTASMSEARSSGEAISSASRRNERAYRMR